MFRHLLQVREQAILINLGSLRAIAMYERVLIFNYNRSVVTFNNHKLLPFFQNLPSISL